MSVVVQHRRDTTANVEANAPAAGELWMDTTKNELSLGNGGLVGGVRLAKKNTGEVLIAAQLVANTNDYNPAGLKHASNLLISTDAARDITGLVAAGVVDTLDGREITIYNAGAFNAVLKDQNAASAAANRFDLGGTDITLAAKSSVTLRYRTQGALNRWEVKASTAGAAVADGAVIARKLAASAMGAFVGMINGTIVPSVGASALTVALKTLLGADPSAADPVYAIFRNATPATGDYTVLTITAATSLVISSGSSMGVAANNTAFKLWLTGFNDAGTFRLGLINCLSGADIFPLDAWGIASSTAEGGAGAADVAQIFYTGVAVASKAYVPLAYMTWETGLAAAGTWSAGPTRTQLFGYGVPLPGTIIRTASSFSGAVATGTTLIPNDDTVPQSTEGDQYLSQAITPQSAANRLRITSQLELGNSAANEWLTTALFQDAIANALAATVGFQATATAAIQVSLTYEMLAGLTVSTTFKIRGGGNIAGTATFNGTGGGRLYGGSASSFLRVEEIVT